MAEIRVEPKRTGLRWLLIVIALILVALVVWYVVSQRGATRVGSSVDGRTPTGALARGAAHVSVTSVLRAA